MRASFIPIILIFSSFAAPAEAQQSCAHALTGLASITSTLAWLTGSKPNTVTVKLPPSRELSAAELRNFVRGKIGACAVSGSEKAWENEAKELSKTNTNLYDGLARPTVNQAFRSVASAISRLYVHPLNSKPRPMNYNDFVAVDALARTVFAEMRIEKCAGKPYKEAVARTILNRAHDTGNERKFQAADVRGNAVLKSVLRDTQYSVWNNTDEVNGQIEDHLANTKLALCPFEAGQSVGTYQAWQRSLDIAMHAILDENEFMKATNWVGSIEYYTSGIPANKGYKELSAPVYGVKRDSRNRVHKLALSNPSCMRFWKDIRDR